MQPSASVSICQKLNEISALIIKLPDLDYAEINTSISALSAQIAVVANFNATRHLIQEEKPLQVRRIAYNVKALSGKDRWSPLWNLEFRTFMFCILSYTQLVSLPEEQFVWLVKHAEQYVQAQAFPPTWVGAYQIRNAIAYHARHDCMAEVVKKHLQVELELAAMRESEVTSTGREDRQMPGHSYANSSPPENFQAPKDRDNQNSLKRSVPKEDLHSGLGSAPKQPRYEQIRTSNVPWQKEGYTTFSFVKHERLEQLPDLFLTGIKTCSMFKKEMEAGGLAVTTCLSLHLPETSNKDTFFVIRLSYDDGWNLFHALDMGTPVDHV